MIRATIVGVGDVVQTLERIPGKIHGRLKDAIEGQASALLRLAKEKVSSEVLRNRSGTLRRKLNMEMEAGATRIVGKVGIKLSYAAAHEFGFNGNVPVKAHRRRLNLEKTLVEMKDANGASFRKRIDTWTGVAQVKAHRRDMKLPKRSFLRTALEERRRAILDAIAGAVEGGMGQ
jgi:phage gpG-like protein